MILSLISIFLVFNILLVLKFIHGVKRQAQHWGLCTILLLTVLFLTIIPFLYLIDEEAHFYILNIPIGFLYGPTLMVLSSSLRGIHKRNLWVHLIPFVCFFIIYLVFVNNLSFEYNSFLNFVPLFNSGFVLLHFLIYFVLIHPKYFLTRLKERIEFLSRLVVFFLFSSIISIIFLALTSFTKDIEFIWAGRLILISMFLTTLTVLYSANMNYQRAELTLVERENEPGIYDINYYQPAKHRSNSSHPNSELFLAYNVKIIEFVNSLGYLDSELTKEKFSSDLGIPIRHVSQFLKYEYGESYTSFINQLRMAYAEKKLKDRVMDHTIEDLASICGFSSRASFYRNFQAIHGCSPHKFRNDQLIAQ